jgi:hypothetical protein
VTTPHDASIGWQALPVAIFADQSLIWGLICRETLTHLKVPARFLSAAAIREHALDPHRILLVPGGWATHKLRALGEPGQKAVAEFVENGGSYLGFCGGAGLALNGPGLLNLAPVRRLPFAERLPNASGPVWISPGSDHPAWEDLPRPLPTSIWWPSQFQWPAGAGVSVLASYRAVAKDFVVADLPLGDLRGLPGSTPWTEWESHYGINLDPKRLEGEPAILEARYGKGRVVLSYPHLETPGDEWGHRLLWNLLKYLDQQAHGSEKEAPIIDMPVPETPCAGSLYHLDCARRIIDDLIDFGSRHLLWSWRTPWLLNWRRGIRGLEYGAIAVCLRFLREQLPPLVDHSRATSSWLQPARELVVHVNAFCKLAKRLLIEEKVSTQSAVLSKIGSVNTTVDSLRGELFGTRMNHGGRCREVLDRIDRLLLWTWRLLES